MREGKKGQCSDAWRPPITPRGERGWSIYIHASTCLGFSNSPPAFSLALVFLIPWRLTLFCGCARPSCMLFLYGTHRIHDKGMKSAAVKGAYCDGLCSLRIFPLRVHRSKNEGAECNRWTQEPRLILV